MRIRKRTLGILAALGIAASTLLAPQANAAALTIEGNVCTLSPSAAEGDRLVAHYVEWSRNMITELKREVPAARSDIDYVMNNATSGESTPEIDAALTRIVAASLDEGFWDNNNDPEAVAVMYIAMVTEELAPRFRGNQVFDRNTIPLNPQDPRSPIDPSIPISPALQRLFQNAAPNSSGAITDWYREVYAACRNGVPGTYNIGAGGGGGGGNGGGGSSFLSS